MLYFTAGALVPDLPPEAIHGQIARVREILEPHRAEQDYLNFTERDGRLADFFDPHTYAKLAKVKAEYDQAGIFQANFEL